MPPPKNHVCVDGIGIIGREVEDLAQIDAIHVPGQHRLVPLNVVALLLVPGGYLAEREVGIDIGTPQLLLLTMTIDIDKSYAHIYGCFRPKRGQVGTRCNIAK